MSDRMTLAAAPHADFADLVVRAWRRALALARYLRAQRRRRREARRFTGELAALDDRMLRDLGLDRSEIGSMAAEAAGLTDVTRLRAFVNVHYLR